MPHSSNHPSNLLSHPFKRNIICLLIQDLYRGIMKALLHSNSKYSSFITYQVLQPWHDQWTISTGVMDCLWLGCPSPEGEFKNNWHWPLNSIYHTVNCSLVTVYKVSSRYVVLDIRGIPREHIRSMCKKYDFFWKYELNDGYLEFNQSEYPIPHWVRCWKTSCFPHVLSLTITCIHFLSI